MAIQGMDHFTVMTTDTAATVAFYRDVLGLEPGPRPDFGIPGAWLYTDGRAVLHVIEKSEIPKAAGVLDHMAFRGGDLPLYLKRLKARALPYNLRRLPEDGHAGGTWQLFFSDPSGARVEIDFDKSEREEG
jgi:catechol 2,3-dioxygenase-like lactoylglutathione lyase family enzyme